MPAEDNQDLAHRVAEEERKAIVRRVYEAFSSGNLDALDELLDPNFVDHNPIPGQAPGAEGVKQTIAMFRSGFPDLRATVEDLIAEGHTVASRVTYRGTHQGEFMGMPATGKQVTISWMDIMRIAGGRITERWGNGDELGMLQQLGAIPAPGEAAS